MTFVSRATVVAFAAVIFIIAGVTLAALSPSLSCRPIFLRLAVGEDRCAISALAAKDYVAAERASRAALRLAPYDNGALVRLVYIDQTRTGTFGPSGLQALDLSYRRVPLDRVLGFWRIRFGLEHWDQLTPDLRRAVRNEMMAFASEPGHRWPLRAVLEDIRNPTGRLVAALWDLQISRYQ